MKSKLKIITTIVAAAVLVMSSIPFRGSAASDVAGGPVISFSVFYQSLSPYGRWINYSNYGQVWIPQLGASFQPYTTNGHWVYSDYGWTWVSDYSWGWAPFHYGRWLYDNAYGWIWVPGEQWAPAWVAWRNSSDYYGWAPLGPGMDVSISIGIPAARWCFVPRAYFGSSRAYRYYVPRTRNVTIIHNTTIIRNVNVYQNNRYFTGPSRTDVQHATRRTVRPVRIASAPRAGAARVNNSQLSIYRPAVQRNANAARPAPVRSGSGTARPNRTVSPNAASRNRITPRGSSSTPAERARPAAPARTAPASPARTAPARPAPSNPQPATAPQRRPTESHEPARRTPTPRAIEHAPARSAPSRPAHTTERSAPRENRSAHPAGRGR